MPSRFERYRMVDGSTPLAARYFNQVWQDIDLRIATLEEIKLSWQNAVDEVVRFGLTRIDELIREPLQAVVELSNQASAGSAELEQLRRLAQEHTTALALLIDTLRGETQTQVGTFIAAAESAINNSKSATAADLAAWKAQRTAELDLWVSSFETALQAAREEIDAKVTTLARQRMVRKSASFMPLAADIATHFEINATAAVTMPAAATLGAGWWCYLRNSGTGAITLQAPAGSTIDGLSSYLMYPGECRMLQCDGLVLRTQIINPMHLTMRESFDFVKPPGYRAFDVDLRGATGGGGSGGAGGYSTSAYHAAGGGGASGGLGARSTAIFPAGILQPVTPFAVGAAGLGAAGVSAPAGTPINVVVDGVKGSAGGDTKVTIEGTTFIAGGGPGGPGGKGTSGASSGSPGAAVSAGVENVTGKYTAPQSAKRYRYLAGNPFGISNPGIAGGFASDRERIPGGLGGLAVTDALASGSTGAGGNGGGSRSGAVESVSQPGLNGVSGLVVIEGVV